MSTWFIPDIDRSYHGYNVWEGRTSTGISLNNNECEWTSTQRNAPRVHIRIAIVSLKD